MEVTFEVASETEQLLRAMLKSEFEIASALDWEDHPVVHEVKLQFELVPAGAAKPSTEGPSA